MCFRPSTASGGAVQKNKCPECGKINKPMATECVVCGHDLTPPDQAAAPDLKGEHDRMMAARRGAPGAPKVPGAPSVPKKPGSPNA